MFHRGVAEKLFVMDNVHMKMINRRQKIHRHLIYLIFTACNKVMFSYVCVIL